MRQTTRSALIPAKVRLIATTAQAEPASAAAARQQRAAPPRLLSLDAFRGLTIAGMILVNNPGTWSAAYWPLLHAEWHGWTPTDLIFPFFLFIVGVSMTLSFATRAARGATRTALAMHTLRRSAIIFAIGLFMAGFPFFNLARIRIPGVLQRIAVCYLLAALIVLFASRRTRLVTICVLLFGYWALLALVLVPGYGVGRLDAEGNLGAYIDRALLQGHLWKPMWDPEGLLSTLPAIATTLLGAALGDWLRAASDPARMLRGMFLAGAAGLIAGQLWHFWFPINKNIWTSSYVIFTAGFACLVLGLCYWAIDLKGWKKWAHPFVVFGANAIIVFALSGLLAKSLGLWKFTSPDGATISAQRLIFQSTFAPLAVDALGGMKFPSFLFALTYILFWLFLMWLLYRRRIFIKI